MRRTSNAASKASTTAKISGDKMRGVAAVCVLDMVFPRSGSGDGGRGRNCSRGGCAFAAICVRQSCLERRAGIEPANTGFADLRVSRFATGAYSVDCMMAMRIAIARLSLPKNRKPTCHFNLWRWVAWLRPDCSSASLSYSSRQSFPARHARCGSGRYRRWMRRTASCWECSTGRLRAARATRTGLVTADGRTAQRSTRLRSLQRSVPGR